jgi:hypothetical protein
MRKTLLVSLVFFWCQSTVFGQAVRFGAIGGVRLDNPNAFLRNESKRYVVGPSVEIRLPGRFAVEVDALYRRLGTSFHYNLLGSGDYPALSVVSRERGNSWELPVLGKYYFETRSPRWQPFLGTGYAFRSVWLNTVWSGGGLTSFGSRRTPMGIGATAAAGVRVNAGRLAISPQFRYTRWSDATLGSRKNQVDFMVGIHF